MRNTNFQVSLMFGDRKLVSLQLNTMKVEVFGGNNLDKVLIHDGNVRLSGTLYDSIQWVHYPWVIKSE